MWTRRNLLWPVAIAITAAGTVRGQHTCPANDTPVPAFVIAAAAGTPGDFASALAEVRACAGFIVRDDRSRRVSRAWRYDPSEPSRTVAEAFKAFQAAHPTFRVEESRGFWLSSEKGVDPESGILSANLGRFEVTRLRAIDAFRHAVAHAVPGLTPKGGFVGSILGRPEDPPVSLDDLTGPYVTVRLDKATLPRVLEEIGRSAPGLLWMLYGTSDTAIPAYRLVIFLPYGMRQPIEGVIR